MWVGRIIEKVAEGGVPDANIAGSGDIPLDGGAEVGVPRGRGDGDGGGGISFADGRGAGEGAGLGLTVKAWLRGSGRFFFVCLQLFM